MIKPRKVRCTSLRNLAHSSKLILTGLAISFAVIGASCNNSNFASGSSPTDANGKEQNAGSSRGGGKGGGGRITGEEVAEKKFTAMAIPGKLLVVVMDATSNQPIEGAKVSVDGAKSGSTTDAQGQVTVAYDAGSSHVVVTAKGYAEDSRQLVAEPASLIVYLSPALKSDQARIILSWNASPKDIDGHLYIQPKSGKDDHIYYVNKKSSQVNMDYDSKLGFGPETMTITKLVPGTYTYRVSDFSNCSAFNVSMSREALSNESGARVHFLVGDDSRVIEIPQGQSGRIWSVLSFDVDEKLKVKLKLDNLFGDNCENYKY